jgi:hypothetical protein
MLDLRCMLVDIRSSIVIIYVLVVLRKSRSEAVACIYSGYGGCSDGGYIIVLGLDYILQYAVST